VRLDGGSASVVAATPDPEVDVAGLGFTPQTVDGACAVAQSGATTRLGLNRERRVVLRADAGNARPAADAGPFQRVEPGATVTLDGSASCDAEGTALTARWELVSAPAGSAWALTGADTMHPTLTADRVGPYRIRLVVTDASGAASLEQEALVIAGPRCGDGVDNDVDGLIVTDDGADCDGIDPPPTTTTTTSTTTTSTTTTTTTTTTNPTGPSSTTTWTQAVAPTSTLAASAPMPAAGTTPAVVAVAVVGDPRFTG
jgi:hypothetical protein